MVYFLRTNVLYIHHFIYFMYCNCKLTIYSWKKTPHQNLSKKSKEKSENTTLSDEC